MRKTLLALVVAGLAGGPACVDLKEVPISGITGPYLDTVQGFDAAVNASYEATRDFYGPQRGWGVTIFGTDEYTRGADGGYKYINDYTAQLNGDDQYFRENWERLWRGINTTNAVVGRSSTVNLTDAVRNPKIAEARFLRALYYFDLVRMYGDLPLQLTETTVPVIETTRDPAAKIYDAIIADLLFAEANLPSTQKDYGRATKPAAEHLLALVYLTRAAPGDFALAATMGKKVIADPQFGLLPRWADNYVFANKKNKEVVWSVQYTQDPLTTGAGNEGHLFFLMAYELWPGMKRDVVYGRAFKRFRPTDWLLGLWDRTKDSRYDDGYQTVWLANIPKAAGKQGTCPACTSGGALNPGDTAIWMPGYEVTNALRLSKPYTIITPSQYTDAAFPPINKFLDPFRLAINDMRGSRDYVVMRLADIYLLVAEALIRDGKPDQALPYVNAIRERSAKPGVPASQMDAALTDMNIDFLLDERSREMAGEGSRWFDLVRTGKLLERVQKYNKAAAPNIQAFHVLRPIPNQQIQAAPGFPQNPGY